MSAEDMRRYRERYPERVAATRRAFRERHPERVAEWRRQWRQNQTPEQRRITAFVRNSNRRARAIGEAGRLTAAELRQITGPCSYCGGEATGWDHVIALAGGGPNTAANLVRSCLPCNLSRPRPFARKRAA